jgi:DNA-binding transcriptional regulator YiaG
MANLAQAQWKPGMDLPYVIPLSDGSMLAITLSAAWLKADRTGQPMLLPPAVRALDRLEAVFSAQERLTSGFIVSLREATGLTQSEFGEKLGVSKMTVSRWECGRMRPNAAAAKQILKLQAEARRQGVKISGEKRTSRPAASVLRTLPRKAS